MKQTSPLMLGVCAVLACISLGLIGYICLGSSTDTTVAPARVAVVDLDAIALKLGRFDAMNQKLRDQGASYDDQLKKIQADFQSQVTTKENEIKSMGDQATDDQKKQLVGMVQVANNQFNLAKRKAVAAVQQQKALLIQEFRREAVAVAEKVAKEQGFDMVVAKNPTVLLSFDPSLDITEAVIEAMPVSAPVAQESTEEVASSQNQPATEEVARTNENVYR
jgi:Skp family chaperone for outer membrane proteins